jgi:energy-coupling factor transport system permease protein
MRWVGARAARTGPGLHPLTALSAAVSSAVITTAAASWPLSALMALAAGLLAVRAGVARRVLAAGAVILVPFAISLLMLHGLFFPEGRTVLAAWGPARVTAEGLAFALETGTRTGACVLVLLLFSFTVSVPDLITALTERRLPRQFSFVVASTLTLVPAIARRLDRISQAQQARGLVLRGGPLSRLAAVRLQMVPLVLGLIDDAGSRSQALDARGFARPGVRTSYRTLTDAPAQRRIRAAALVLAGAAVLLRVVVSWPGTGPS